jgi:hypothetical protein
MAWSNWPNSNHNSGAVTDIELEQLVAPYTPSGVIGKPSDSTLIYGDSSGRQVKSRAGKFVLIRGQLAWSGSTDTTYAIASNSGATRYDLIVAQFDRATLIANVIVVTGTPGSGPPSLTTNTGTTGVYQIALAQVTVVHSATTIASTDVKQLAYFVAPQKIVCTSTTRPPHAVGLDIYETDTTNSYTSDGANWINPNEDTGYVALTSTSGWSLSVDTARRVNGIVEIRLEVIRTGAALAPNTVETIATLPAGFAPSRFMHWTGFVSGDTALPGSVIRGHVETSGAITIVAYNLVDTVTISSKVVLVPGAKLLTGAIVIPSIPAYAIGG